MCNYPGLQKNFPQVVSALFAHFEFPSLLEVVTSPKSCSRPCPPTLPGRASSSPTGSLQQSGTLPSLPGLPFPALCLHREYWQENNVFTITFNCPAGLESQGMCLPLGIYLDFEWGGDDKRWRRRREKRVPAIQRPAPPSEYIFIDFLLCSSQCHYQIRISVIIQ